MGLALGATAAAIVVLVFLFVAWRVHRRVLLNASHDQELMRLICDSVRDGSLEGVLLVVGSIHDPGYRCLDTGQGR